MQYWHVRGTHYSNVLNRVAELLTKDEAEIATLTRTSVYEIRRMIKTLDDAVVLIKRIQRNLPKEKQ